MLAAQEKGVMAIRFAPACILGLALVPTLAAAAAADQCGDADLSQLKARFYVAPTGTDSDSCGTVATAACLSIQQGIKRCSGAPCAVLVRYGLYSLEESIKLSNGVSVYGRCVFSGDSARKYRSAIEAPPDGKPGIVADKINLPTLLDGVLRLGLRCDDLAGGRREHRGPVWATATD